MQAAADGSGQVVLLRDAQAIVTPLATLTRTSAPATVSDTVEDNEAVTTDEQPAPQPEAAAPEARPPQPEPQQQARPQPQAQQNTSRPSFDCRNARTRGEIAVCGDSRLAALHVSMAAQYRRALASAAPDERALLQSTRDRFLRYRDRCRDRQCMADAYVGRMREIRDIARGNWQPPR